jgi:hypothetical protein
MKTHNFNQFFSSYIGPIMLVTAVTFSFPTFKFLLASSMVFHMLVQIPLLVLTGYLFTKTTTKKYYLKEKSYGIYVYTGFWFWILMCMMFWMLPISLDKAVQNGYWDVFKIFTLLISGLLVRPALKAPIVLSLFFVGNLVLMLFSVGYFYLETEQRLCNSYLMESQKATGICMIVVAIAMSLAFAWKSQH